MKVRISINRMGHLTLSPVSSEVSARLRRYLAKSGAENPDPSVYLQLDTDVESLLSGLPAEVSKDIREGWDRVVLMDPRTFGSYCGYDAGDNCRQWHDRAKAVRKPRLPLIRIYRSKLDGIKVELYDTGRTDDRGVTEIRFRIFDYNYQKGKPVIEEDGYCPSPLWDLHGLLPVADLLQFVPGIYSWTDPEVKTWIRARGEYLSLIGSDLEERARKREGK
jgi:hypothetical protein